MMSLVDDSASPPDKRTLDLANAVEMVRVTLAEIEKAYDALEPLAAIADRWEDDGLDESRPYWIANGVEKRRDPKDVELYTGRGGKELLTLADAMRARETRRAIEPLMRGRR